MVSRRARWAPRGPQRARSALRGLGRVAARGCTLYYATDSFDLVFNLICWLFVTAGSRSSRELYPLKFVEPLDSRSPSVDLIPEREDGSDQFGRAGAASGLPSRGRRPSMLRHRETLLHGPHLRADDLHLPVRSPQLPAPRTPRFPPALHVLRPLPGGHLRLLPSCPRWGSASFLPFLRKYTLHNPLYASLRYSRYIDVGLPWEPSLRAL